MGAWDIENFGNDAAADLTAEVLEDGKAVLARVLTEVASLGDDESVEAPEDEEALAAAEIVAAGLGRPAEDCPEEVLEWAQEHQPTTARRGLLRRKVDLVELARRAVTRVMNDSEARELWEDSGDLDTWLEVQRDLLARLS